MLGVELLIQLNSLSVLSQPRQQIRQPVSQEDHPSISNPARTNNVVTVDLILHFYPSSQAHGLVGKALLRFPGCESRHIRGLTRPVFSLSLRESYTTKINIRSRVRLDIGRHSIDTSTGSGLSWQEKRSGQPAMNRSKQARYGY